MSTRDQGQGEIRFDNPNADDDFLTDIARIDTERFVVGDGNHDALVWKLDGTSASLGCRVDAAGEVVLAETTAGSAGSRKAPSGGGAPTPPNEPDRSDPRGIAREGEEAGRTDHGRDKVGGARTTSEQG